MQPADRVREARKQLRIADEEVDHEIVEAYLQDARAQARAALAHLDGSESPEVDGQPDAGTIDVVYRPTGRSWRKVSFEPRADGWERRTYHHNGCQWVYEGSELVEDVAIKTSESDGEVRA